jgi:nucleoside-diphosphate-sugar epimerase
MTLASILEDLDAVSDTIAIVAIGGSGFYFVKGVLGSSFEGSVAGGVEAFVTNRDRVCHWAAWSGLMTANDRGMAHARNVEGPFNTMVACSAANALCSVHLGTRAATVSGLKGAVYGAVARLALEIIGVVVLGSAERRKALTS